MKKKRRNGIKERNKREKDVTIGGKKHRLNTSNPT